MKDPRVHRNCCENSVVEIHRPSHSAAVFSTVLPLLAHLIDFVSATWIPSIPHQVSPPYTMEQLDEISILIPDLEVQQTYLFRPYHYKFHQHCDSFHQCSLLLSHPPASASSHSEFENFCSRSKPGTQILFVMFAFGVTRSEISIARGSRFWPLIDPDSIIVFSSSLNLRIKCLIWGSMGFFGSTIVEAGFWMHFSSFCVKPLIFLLSSGSSSSAFSSSSTIIFFYRFISCFRSWESRSSILEAVKNYISWLFCLGQCQI